MVYSESAIIAQDSIGTDLSGTVSSLTRTIIPVVYVTSKSY